MKASRRLDFKCSKLSGVPVMKLSTTTTSCSSPRNRSTRCEPMNPAPPVMTVRTFLPPNNSKWRSHSDSIARGIIHQSRRLCRQVAASQESNLDCRAKRRTVSFPQDTLFWKDAGLMAGRPIRTYTVMPHLPKRLQALQQLAYNMWWCWNHDTVSLFRRIDADLFEAVENSPVKLLSGLDQSRLEQLLKDDGFLASMDRILEAFNQYMASPTWFDETHAGKDAKSCRIAYFSAEFGIHESVPTYSGGLGVLAGDHLKSASDLGVPLVGIGLMYRE